MRTLKRLSIFTALMLLSGCASAIDDSSQVVRLNTPGASEAECTLTNGVKYHIRTGETARIMRSHRDLVADCYASGDRYRQVIFESSLNDWGYANVTNGIIPGATVDHLSGALYTYPKILTVDFTGMPIRGFDSPRYHNNDGPNPYTQAIESFGNSTPAVPEDSEYMKRGLQKRDTAVNVNPFSNGTTTTTSSVAAGTSYTGSDGPYQGGGSGPKYTGKNAEELTRSANPAVFK